MVVIIIDVNDGGGRGSGSGGGSGGNAGRGRLEGAGGPRVGRQPVEAHRAQGRKGRAQGVEGTVQADGGLRLARWAAKLQFAARRLRDAP